MSSIFKAYAPTERLSGQPFGDISPDRSVIIGKGQNLFLYAGSNNYYHQYVGLASQDQGIRWAELDAQRRNTMSSTIPMFSLYVPNKATCLPDLYPLMLPQVPTPIFATLREAIGMDPATIFCDALLTASRAENRFSESPWRLVDSHWSEFGCLLTANEFLVRVGLRPIETGRTDCTPTEQGGDLSQKFKNTPLLEIRHLELIDTEDAPSKIYDSGDGVAYAGHIGRRVTWRNENAEASMHLLVIGNSFSGMGTKPTELTYWLARRFRQVTFLHSPHIPIDVCEFYKPDMVLFQGLERFLIALPNDTFTATFLENLYTSPAGS